MPRDQQRNAQITLRVAPALYGRVLALRAKLGGVKLNLSEALEPALAAYLDALEAGGTAAIVGRAETRGDLRRRVAELEAQLAARRAPAYEPPD